MSGGSYDYLWFHEWSAKVEQLERMRDRLYELGYHTASDVTANVLSVLKEIDDNQRLRDAWMAVEWMDSGDTGIEQLVARMRDLGWRQETPCTHTTS